MKLRYMGVCKDFNKLPVGDLPEHAVKFVEPDNKEELEKAVLPFMLPPIILIGLALLIRFLVYGGLNLNISLDMWRVLLICIALIFAAMIIHELLHAICFPKDSEVHIYINLSFFFVHSTAPVSKRRFIFMSLLPNIILGFLPLIIWIFVPLPIAISTTVLIFSAIMLICGCGDYMNAYNAYRQMPINSMQQLSGMNSYWFMPDEK